MNTSQVEALIGILSIVLSIAASVVTAALMIGKYREKVDSLERSRDKLESKLDSCKSEIDGLKEFKVSAQKFIDSKIYQSNSPLSLTEYGRKLVKESGFEKIFEEHKDELVQMLNKLSPQTAYDVQEVSRSFMDGLDNYEPFAPIKEYAFKTGSDFKQILRAGAIMMRDYYLTKHPEIDATKDY
jgi:uncharacterized protein YihD (DUF1040 family)